MKRLALCCASVAVVGLLAAAFSTAPALADDSTCNATVSATPGDDEVEDQFIYKTFGVTLTADVPCAKVYVDLVTTEQLPDGESVTKTDHGYREVSAESIYTVRYKIARDNALADYEFKITRCVICGADER